MTGRSSSVTIGTAEAETEPANASTATIKSVERAAAILSFFTPSQPRLTLTDITTRLGASKATAHRYTVALRERNLLRYDRVSSEFTLGPHVLTLAAAARSGLPLIGIAGPAMERLVTEVNETVVLSIWDGTAPVVVRVEDDTERLLRISVRVGARLEQHSAQGTVFHAFLDRDEHAETRPSRDERELSMVRSLGIAIGSPGRHGVRTVAAPVFVEDRIVAVLAIVGTTATLSDDVSSPAAKSLARAAADLSEQLGQVAAERAVL